MATTKEKGKNITLSVNGHPVGCDKTCSISLTSSTVDSTTKCSVDSVTGVVFNEIAANILSGQITGNGLQPVKTSAGTDPYALVELAGLMLAQTQVDVTWTNKNATIGFYSKGFITSLKSDGAFDAEVTYDYTIDLNGKISQTPLT